VLKSPSIPLLKRGSCFSLLKSLVMGEEILPYQGESKRGVAELFSCLWMCW